MTIETANGKQDHSRPTHYPCSVRRRVDQIYKCCTQGEHIGSRRGQAKFAHKSYMLNMFRRDLTEHMCTKNMISSEFRSCSIRQTSIDLLLQLCHSLFQAALFILAH